MKKHKVNCRALSVLLTIAMLFSFMTVGVFAVDVADSSVKSAILYTLNEDNKLEYNSVHSAELAKDVAVSDKTGSKIDSLDALTKVMGEADAPAEVHSYKTGERTLGRAVTADLTLDKSGTITAIEVTGVRERPVIGISWKSDKIGDDYKGFAEAYERNGALAVYLPQVKSEAEAKKIFQNINGVFMTGGSDWNPYLYGELQTPHGSGTPNDARDASDIFLMQQAVAMDVPMLAVCRGEQGFNVAMGGKLIQDIPYYLGQKVISGEIAPERVTQVLSGPSEADLAKIAEANKTTVDQLPEILRTFVQDTGYNQFDFSKAEEVKIGATYDKETKTYAEGTECEAGHLRVWVDGLVHSGGKGYHQLTAGTDNEQIAIDYSKSKWLGEIFGNVEKIDLIATAHHQSVDPENLGEGLTIVACSSDGIVEAIEHQDSLFCLALQWHPERDALKDSRDSGVNLDQSNAPLRALVKYAGIKWDRINSVSFTDVKAGAYYEDAVKWAVDKAVTSGKTVTTFAPNESCTRAQAVTFLWRAAGSPEPTATEMTFTDVKADSYYYKAVLWAVENKITSGMSDTLFAPDAVCSRSQIVTFLYRMQNSPESKAENPFTDVKADAYYANAVLWAVENGVTTGASATTFDPAGNCTRGQIVTFLYRCLNK